MSKATLVKMRPRMGDKSLPFAVALDPATGEVLAEYPLNTLEDVQNAVVRARRAQADWENAPLKVRVKHVKKIRDYILDHCDELAAIISRDNGKTLVDAMATEVVPAAMAAGYYCKMARRFLEDRKLAAGNVLFFNKRSRIVRIPFGVVGIISPWNYPFAIPFSEIIMALLAGNAVLFKAASETQLVGDALRRCVDAADLPKDVFTYITMPGSQAGDAFLDSGIDKLFFTGSVPVGKYLMKKASELLIPCMLELGGNDPMIVCEDADLKRAAAGAVWAGMQNAGQSCGGVERVYVHRKVYDEFLRLLKIRVESLRIGNGSDFNTDIGAMTTTRQIDAVRRQIDEALEMGAEIYAERKVPVELKGQFLPCVVLTNVNHQMSVMKDETFGPVLGVMPFDTLDEAIRLANDTYLGLHGSVWSRNRSRAMQIARRIKSGSVMVNDHLMSHGLAECPWGGFKESSIGRTHGEIGFAEMTQPLAIINDILPLARRNFWWHPFDRKLYEGVRGVIELLYAGSLFRKIGGAVRLMKVFLRTFRAV